MEGQKSNSNYEANKEQRLPLVEERLVIRSESVPTGEVRVTKQVEEQTVDVELPTILTAYEVERVELNRVVDAVPEQRTEGETIVIPVVREEAVVVKKLILEAEIRLRKRQTVNQRTESVTLRSETARIERLKL